MTDLAGGDSIRPGEAAALLEDVHRLSHEVRREIRRQGRPWLVIWAIVCLGAALTGLTPIAGSYWIVAVPFAIGVTAWFDWKDHYANGIRIRDWPYWLAGGAIAVLNTIAGWVLPPERVAIAVWVVMGVGFAAMARHGRLPGLARRLLGTAAATTMAGFVVDPFSVYVMAGFAFAGVLGFTASELRSRP